MKLGERLQSMTTEAKQQTRILVQTAVAACEEKKGTDIRILELDPIDSGLSDFFLITSASNDRQTVAIADEIEHRLKTDFGVYPNSIEGRRKGDWILLDYVDFVVHIFLAERRAFYDIERLRKSARPLTPAEFDAELRAELAAKTLAARKKKSSAKTKAAPKAKKPAAKKVAAKRASPAKTVTKKAASKPALKKVPTKMTATNKTPAKKSVPKTSAAKKAVTKKAPASKAAPKKTTAKKKANKKA
jgi:ribosome-associated protein